MNQAEKDGSLAPASEDEAIEVEFLLMEPKVDPVSVDGMLGFDMDNSGGFMAIEDLPSEFGGLVSNTTLEGEDDTKLEVLDEMPYEVDEVGYLQARNGISSTCEDYLLDIEFAERVPKLDCNSTEGFHSQSKDSEHQIAGFIKSDNEKLGMPKSSTAITLIPECQSDVLEKTICEFHNALSNNCECKTSDKDKWWPQVPTSFDLQNVDKLEDALNFLEGSISSNEKEEDMIFSPDLTSGSIFCTKIILQNDGASIGAEVVEQGPSGKDASTRSTVETGIVGDLPEEKRLRKPTRRYIQESSELNSRYSWRRQEISTSTSKDNFVGVGSVGSNSDDEPTTDESEDDWITTASSENCCGPRKIHRPWNLSEVRKLIDGVSQHGVGRWTVIKRRLFSSSSHRTAVDLKDKWRNLLRASYLQKQSKREDDQNRKNAWRPLPKSVLLRVSELAIIHPYPCRYHKSKLSSAHPVSSPAVPLKRRNVGSRS